MVIQYPLLDFIDFRLLMFYHRNVGKVSEKKAETGFLRIQSLPFQISFLIFQLPFTTSTAFCS